MYQVNGYGHDEKEKEEEEFFLTFRISLINFQGFILHLDFVRFYFMFQSKRLAHHLLGNVQNSKGKFAIIKIKSIRQLSVPIFG